MRKTNIFNVFERNFINFYFWDVTLCFAKRKYIDKKELRTMNLQLLNTGKWLVNEK